MLVGLTDQVDTDKLAGYRLIHRIVLLSHARWRSQDITLDALRASILHWRHWFWLLLLFGFLRNPPITDNRHFALIRFRFLLWDTNVAAKKLFALSLDSCLLRDWFDGVGGIGNRSSKHRYGNNYSRHRQLQCAQDAAVSVSSVHGMPPQGCERATNSLANVLSHRSLHQLLV